ncbi:MAG TPA: heme biosynthesis HemY N-terminal domain-containing protein [Rhodocyclaceae bacterium]|nr:heme biosynthesis HemY N-terminal domain-containing protein [Rhodocyclaceae bacterium]
MRAIFWLLTLAALAVGLALAARYNEGYVLVVMPPWRIEVSLNLFLLSTALGYIVVYMLSRTVSHMVGLPRKVAEFRQRRRRQLAETALHDAWRLIQEGRYGQALKCAEKAWPDHSTPGLAALAGWRAAHALHDAQHAAPWETRVREADASGLRAARLMMETEIALDERRFEDAGAALRQLAQQGGRHIAALRLSLRAEQGMKNWREVARLARQLEKYQALSHEQANPIRRHAIREALRENAGDLPELLNYWRSLAQSDRTDPLLALEVTRALTASGQFREAQRITEEALGKNWDTALVLAYAECGGNEDGNFGNYVGSQAAGNVVGRIAHGEKWLAQHPRDGALLFTLGRLCGQQKLWGKARSYLEASLSIEPTRAVHVELAKLFDQLEESALAERHYRAAALF